MSSEEKHKINVWIPGSLWKQIESLGYDSPTKATISAFEVLVLQEAKGSNQEVLGSSQEALGSVQEIEGYKRDIIGYKENIKYLNMEIARLKESFANSPDPVELAEMKGLYEGKMQVIDEKDKRIEALEREVSRLDMFAHYFKNIEVKQIEAPVEKKPWWQFW